ncbi:hypothetical protein [Rhizobium binxianense]
MRNIEDFNHVFEPVSACLFGHAGKFMQDRRAGCLFRREKIGKKLTNNFIILCELLRGTALGTVTQN